MNEQAINPPAVQTLALRDIHLPEAISWWPLAPGWWLLLAALVFITLAAIITKKIYKRRQLKRDIAAELTQIKQQFAQSSNKSQLAKSLSILLRRASISYNPKANIAGLTGESWLAWLDDTHKINAGHTAAQTRFKSDTGKVLLSAPYLPQNTRLDFNADALIDLCSSWLLTAHSSKQGQFSKRTESS